MAIETVETAAPHDLLGSAVQRREDPPLLTGDAEYTDDIQHARTVHLAILGSQFAHARIAGIDTTAAEALDGVVGVYTAADIEASGVPGRLRTDSPPDAEAPPHPMLAVDRVRYHGQPVAGVVAEDRYTASEAADLIDVDFEPLEAVVDPVAALDDGAPAVHDSHPDNRAFDWENGDAATTDRAFEAADRVVELDFEINRVVPTAMEPRAAVARYRKSTGTLSVEMSTQNPHKVQSDLSTALDLPAHRIRVRPPHVGGGFGAKLQPYTGHHLAAWCAMQLGRPVKWVATRTEDCTSMIHSRHQVVEAAAAVDADGRIAGVRARTIAPVGGYIGPGGSGVPQNMGRMATGQYDIPAAHVHVTGAFTNTTPLGAYRGAGRPEATYFIERLIDAVADALDEDPVEVRRRNFIAPEDFPYETPLGRSYDSGEYDRALSRALEAVDYGALRAEQAEAREAGRYLGIGLSCYVEGCGAAPGWHEVGVVEVLPSGQVVVKSGTAEIGTGHRTSYAQIVGDELGIDAEDIEVLEGDTDQVIDGGGTGGSRAMPVGGSAVFEAAVEVRERAREVASHLLETSAEDVEFDDGSFHVRGAPDRAVAFEAVAAAAYDEDAVAAMDLEGGAGLGATSYYDPSNYTFPFGAHVAVVEVDPDAGEISLERYVAVDDVGVQINPKIVEGQIHGGVVQGLGQALMERAVYDDNGTLLTGSLQDYPLPRAFDVPELETDSTVTPSPHNPLGVKGVGEAGAIAAPPAVVNAVVDALEPFGVDDLDMPLTPERLWRAIDAGRA